MFCFVFVQLTSRILFKLVIEINVHVHIRTWRQLFMCVSTIDVQIEIPRCVFCTFSTSCPFILMALDCCIVRQFCHTRVNAGENLF